MSSFILDNSVSMRWLLESEKPADQKYAIKVLESMVDSHALVPDLWRLEATNVLLGAEKRCEISFGQIEGFLSQLDMLPIHVDSLTTNHAFGRTLSLAREYKLSSYDAAYLELAIRETLPLSTLDKKLINAAKKSEVEVYLRNP